MKINKSILAILVIIIVIGIIMTIFFITKNTNNNNIHEKGYKLYGSEYCAGHANEVGLTVMTNYVCHLCGDCKKAGSSPAPVICLECSKETGRCTRCGKLLK